MPVQDDKSFSGCSCQMFQSPGQFHIFSAKRFVAEAAEIPERCGFDENQRAGDEKFLITNGPCPTIVNGEREAGESELAIVPLKTSRAEIQQAFEDYQLGRMGELATAER